MRADRLAVVLTALFLLWVSTGGAPTAQRVQVDMSFFAAIALCAVGALWMAGARAAVRRDRWAWYLLGASALVRVLYGVAWRTGIAWSPAVPDWVLDLRVVQLVLECAGLLMFASARFRRTDRTRLLLDGATILVGVTMLVWFVAFAGSARQGNALPPPASDVVVLMLTSASALFAALLYLRRDDFALRRAAVFYLGAGGMSLVPNAAQWLVYTPGHVVTVWWWAIWLMRCAAARGALAPGRAAPQGSSDAVYRSGGMTHLFLAAANVALVLELSQPSHTRGRWLVLSSSFLMASLVVRQLLELREHAALRRILAREEARFGALVENAYDAVALVRSDGGASYLSPATLRLLGTNPAYEAIWGLLSAFHPADAPRLKEAVTVTGNASQTLVCRLRDAEGAWRNFSLRLLDLREDPLVRAIAVHGHDITRESQLARRLRDAEEVEALGVFAGGLAHDLNNVLAAIAGHVEILLEEAPAGSSAGRELVAIAAATGRATTLTRNLLSLSRRKVPAREVIDLAAMLRERDPELAIAGAGAVRVGARVDRVAFAHALDAVLASVRPGDPVVAPWRIALAVRALDAEAVAVNLEPGSYALLECTADRTDAVARGNSEQSPAPDADVRSGLAVDDETLDLTLARAVLREMGGALTATTSRNARHVTLYVPAAST